MNQIFELLYSNQMLAIKSELRRILDIVADLTQKDIKKDGD